MFMSCVGVWAYIYNCTVTWQWPYAVFHSFFTCNVNSLKKAIWTKNHLAWLPKFRICPIYCQQIWICYTILLKYFPPHRELIIFQKCVLTVFYRTRLKFCSVRDREYSFQIMCNFCNILFNLGDFVKLVKFFGFEFDNYRCL